MNSRIPASHEFFQGLLWPAVAGNVLWSFGSLLLDPNTKLSADAVGPRLLMLLLVGLYLSLEWLHNYRFLRSEVRALFWIFDGLHLVAISGVAIACSINHHCIWAAMVFFLSVTFLGHLLNAWRAPGRDTGSRFIHAGVHFLAFIFVLITTKLDILADWNSPIAGLATLTFWLIVERKDIKEALFD
jgi:hypothetical protein